GLSGTGKEQVAVRFRMTEGEHEGKTVLWYSYFNTQENATRTLNSLRACGWIGDDLSDLQGIENNEVEIVLEVEEYEGKTRTKVRWVNAMGGGPILTKRMSDAEKKAFSARMKGLAVALRTRSPSLSDQSHKRTRESKSNSHPSEWDV